MAGALDGIRRYERRRRFWRLVEVRGREECWPWLGPLDTEGRGRYRGSRADAQAYRLVRAELPAGADLRHTCGNRRCVNPEHMDPAMGSA